VSSIKHKISPCLWIEKDARKAVEYYQSIFKDTALVSYKEYKNTGSPSGDFDIAEMDLMVLGSRFWQQDHCLNSMKRFHLQFTVKIRMKWTTIGMHSSQKVAVKGLAAGVKINTGCRGKSFPNDCIN
jgi:predicted 3-demethylubiquinone-9 3-methyltransferase (glyoxalase superfamily)